MLHQIMNKRVSRLIIQNKLVMVESTHFQQFQDLKFQNVSGETFFSDLPKSLVSSQLAWPIILTLITIKSHFKALGLYNFMRGFGWAYKRGGGAYIRVGL